MEAKKTDRADLSKKTTFFFSIGLLLTLTIVTTAFEFKSSGGPVVDLPGKATNNYEGLIDIPLTNQTPPLPPQLPTPIIVEVKDDEEIKNEILPNLDAEATQDAAIPDIAVIADVPVEETDEILVFPEESASPDGGIGSFYRYVQDKMKYPAQARRLGIDGKVFVEFVINKDGSITDVKAIKGIGAGCDEEAVRVLQGAPKWSPGKQRGKAVKQRMVLPIIFKLGDGQ